MSIKLSGMYMAIGDLTFLCSEGLPLCFVGSPKYMIVIIIICSVLLCYRFAQIMTQGYRKHNNSAVEDVATNNL